MVAEVSGQVSRAADTTTTRRQSEPSSSTTGVEGVTLELLDDAGDVMDTTTTDRRGNYRFSSIAETGDYQIRLGGSDQYQPISTATLDLLVSNGKTRLRGLDFLVI
ncbi:MAG: SdrD B-like domain-containing protein [Pirellulaceae bacterium]